MANNYSNLKNSFMYGSKNRLNNFYQNYKNFSNDIEDPIFTGFTLYLNMEQSPLLNGATQYEKEKGGSLASQLETSLKEKYEQLRSNQGNIAYAPTITNIDTFDGDNKIGYSNQTTVYSEGFVYNAIEYIFMVDKLVYGGTLHESPKIDPTNAAKSGGDKNINNINNSTDESQGEDFQNQEELEEQIDENKKKAEELEKENEEKFIQEFETAYNNYIEKKTNKEFVEDNLKERESIVKNYSNISKLEPKFIEALGKAPKLIVEYMNFKIANKKNTKK